MASSYIDVTSSPYNAVGDGVTDDTNAIATALAALPAAGGVLYFPPNHTFLVQHIDISAFSGNLVIMGGGWSSVLKLKNNANDYIIKSTTGSQQGTVVCNLKLDCNGSNQSAASGGINGYKWRRCLIEYVWVHNHYETGILLQGAGGDFGYQNDIRSCFIEGGQGQAGKGRGLYLLNTDENTVSDNLFQNNGGSDTSQGDNFHIRDDNGLTTYKGNKFVNGLGVFKLYGIQTRIIGNIFDGNGGNLVQTNAPGSDLIFENNTAINVGYQASGGSANSINGIYLNVSMCQIRNNYFDSDTSATPKTNSFVKIDTGATYCNIEGNTFNIKASSGTLQGAAYFVSGQPTGTRLRNNNGYDFVNSKAACLTENHGTANIAAGNTSVVVNHGLALQPAIEQIQVTPETTWGTSAKWWVDTVGSTSFTINVNAAPGATFTFGWTAQAGW